MSANTSLSMTFNLPNKIKTFVHFYHLELKNLLKEAFANIFSQKLLFYFEVLNSYLILDDLTQEHPVYKIVCTWEGMGMKSVCVSEWMGDMCARARIKDLKMEQGFIKNF